MAAAAAHQSSAPGWTVVVLVALAAVAAWTLSLYAHPFGPCRKCKATGVNKGSTGKRYGLCKACGGTRRKQRFGSRTLHRWVRSAKSEWQRERALKKEQRAAERTRNPRSHGGGR